MSTDRRSDIIISRGMAHVKRFLLISADAFGSLVSEVGPARGPVLLLLLLVRLLSLVAFEDRAEAGARVGARSRARGATRKPQDTERKMP